MLHKRAAERADGAGWQYVIGKGQGGTPIGRCAEHSPHATEAEARECYAEFVRDSIQLDAYSVSWTSCRARPGGQRCPEPTRSAARYGDDGYGTITLCPRHMTTQDVIEGARLAGPAGDAWVS
jgi:hypothetical protein